MDYHAVERQDGADRQDLGGPGAGTIPGGVGCGRSHDRAIQVRRHAHGGRGVTGQFLRRVKDGEVGERRGEAHEEIAALMPLG